MLEAGPPAYSCIGCGAFLGQDALADEADMEDNSYV